MVKILSYSAIWNSQKGVKINFKLADGQSKSAVVSHDAAAALLTLLKDEPVFFKNGLVYTGSEQPGDADFD